MTDRIEKQILLRAPLERVWRAISDAREFGSWFGLEVDGDFTPHTLLTGRIVPTRVDPEVAKSQEPYTGFAFALLLDRIEPMRLFSFRWHPYAVDTQRDYSQEPMTLVCFALEAVAGDTRLTITETGFDQIALDRRALAFAANDSGWTFQTQLLEKYLAGNFQP